MTSAVNLQTSNTEKLGSRDFSDKPAETVSAVFQPGRGAVRTARGIDMIMGLCCRNSTKKVQNVRDAKEEILAKAGGAE